MQTTTSASVSARRASNLAIAKVVLSGYPVRRGVAAQATVKPAPVPNEFERVRASPSSCPQRASPSSKQVPSGDGQKKAQAAPEPTRHPATKGFSGEAGTRLLGSVIHDRRHLEHIILFRKDQQKRANDQQKRKRRSSKIPNDVRVL